MKDIKTSIAISLSLVFLVGCATTSYENASAANTIVAYERFLKKYPDSGFALEATHRLDALYFKKSEKAGTIQAYESFIKKRENSSFSSVAKNQLKHLYAERDWAKVRENDNIKEYDTFIKRHPGSVRIQEATARQELLKKYKEGWKRVMRDPTERNLAEYCEKNPESPYLPKVRATIRDMEGRDIVDLLKEKKIEIKTKGSGIQSVGVSIRKLVPYPIAVCVPVGSYFVSSSRSAQNMVTTAESKVRITGDGWRRISVSAACANRPRDIPGSGDTFTVQRSPHQQELARLMPVLNRTRVSYATRQAAVWIVTDNASYSDLGILVSRPAYTTVGGTRKIREAETARAMKICDDAGIDIRRKRIWYDRQTIIHGLAEGELKTWLRNQL